jgi:ribosome maturation factor RimP
MELSQAIRHYLEPQLAEKGYILVNAQHQKDKIHGVKITLTIDRIDEQSVAHADCAAVTRIAKAQFEELLEDYILEVSSPGIKKVKPEMIPE